MRTHTLWLFFLQICEAPLLLRLHGFFFFSFFFLPPTAGLSAEPRLSNLFNLCYPLRCYCTTEVFALKKGVTKRKSKGSVSTSFLQLPIRRQKFKHQAWSPVFLCTLGHDYQDVINRPVHSHQVQNSSPPELSFKLHNDSIKYCKVVTSHPLWPLKPFIENHRIINPSLKLIQD